MSLCLLSLRITFLALTLLVYSTSSFCCYECGLLKCNPAPDTSCNIFCCHCGGTICGLTNCLQKSTPKKDAVWVYFNSIDRNHDKVLDLKEAQGYYTNQTESNKGSAAKRTKKDFESEFKKMDANKNGVIDPREFDISLA